MTSSVFFKFKSQKDPSIVEFDGTGISVFELKRDIINKSGLGDGKNFDLAIYNEGSNEEYKDDTTIIPRSTSIIARRQAPSKPGKGTAARYVTGTMPANAKNASRKEQFGRQPASKPATTTAAPTQMTADMTEEQRIAAMFQSQTESWSNQQEEMRNQTPVAFAGRKPQPQNVPDHEPPAPYICYRCGQKGHWIQACPTNDDPTFDNKPRIKRTTGIPRSFLKTVEKPAELSNDGTVDVTKGPSGVMVNAEGEFVVAEPDKASWDKFQAKTQSSAAAQKAAALGSKELQEKGLECALDKRLFIDPMKTPCCEKTYCNDCITNALIESDFFCPGCQTGGILLDDLVPDDATSAKIKVYLEERDTVKKEKERSKSPSVKAESPIESKAKSPTPPGNKSPTPEVKEEPKGTKRPAEEVLENPKIPKGPKAMQQQEAQKQAMLQQQQAMMNGMGFPGMPFFGNNNFNGMNGMNMNMMNGFGMGGMPNPMMMNPMMGGMNFGNFAGMNGMGMNGMNGMNFPGSGMGNMGMMGMMSGQGNAGNGANGAFPNQQKTVFAEPLPNAEDTAYFRKPVNPHRHQGRQRKARPSDYREI